MAEASLQPIYERLNGADSYHPFSANTFTDWAIEAGDIVTITRDSESFTSPVHSSHLSWRGSPQMSLQSRGKKELDSIGKSTQRKFAKSGGAYRAARNVAKKASVYFQKQNPLLTPGIDVQKDDIWVESSLLDTWDDIGELTWDELGDYTWFDFYGAKMYAYDGTKWVQIADEQKANYNFDLFRNTQTELNSVKGDLSGAISQIFQSKELIYTSVRDAQNGLESLISHTAGQIRTEVNDTKNGLQSSITQNADKIALVVEGTGANAHIKPASIVASINTQTGTSQIKISANQIDIDGIVTALNGKLVTVATLAAGTANVAKLSLESGGDFYVREGGSYWGFGNGLTGPMQYTIIDADVDGNVLTLTHLDGTETTFSKATTLSPTWSGSVLTMSAKQTNGGTETTVASKTLGFGSYGSHDIDLAIDTNGYPSRVDATHIRVPLYVGTQNSGSAQPTSRYTKNLDYYIGSLLQEKSASSNGNVTPDSGYIGLSKVTVNVPQSYSWGTQNYVANTNNLPSGTKHTVNNLKSVIVSNRSKRGYIYFTININGTTHVFYFADNGDGWTT